MTSFLTSLHLLSFKQVETVHSSDLNCIKISNKRTCTQGLYSDARSQFFNSRCNDCKQHWGWKKSINSVEKLLKSYKCIFSSWELNQPLLMLFSNGSVVSIELNEENNTLKKIEIDENISGKIIASRIVDAIICEKYIFITYSEPKLTVVHINQGSPSFSAKILGKKKGHLVGFDPRITHIDLYGPSSKNLERKLSLNSSKDHLLVWWKLSSDLVGPWNPSLYGDRAERLNMLIYSLSDCIELLCSVKVQGELINAKYSKQYSNQIFTLEELHSEKETSINVSVYEIAGNQCHHVFISKLPLQGKVLSFDWSFTDKLLISDSNNVLLIFDLKKKTSIVTNLLFSPKCSIWHPQNCIALVTGTSGQVQCFDAALTCIKLKLYYKTSVDCKVLELSSHFTQSCCVQYLLWQKSDFNNSCLLWLDSDLSTFIVLKFTFGSISGNSLSTLEVISQYLKSSSIDEAILLLMSLNWWNLSKLHFRCLSKVINFLLRKPLNLQVQSGLEMALGTFYNNVELMPKRTYRLYEHKVNHLARRFFHQLLRHHQFRKAFLLAVDIESQDLFLDLSHVAKQKGEHVLSLVAFHKANELDGSDESISSSSSYSSASAISFDKPVDWDYTTTSLPLRNTSLVVESTETQVSQSLNTRNKLTFSPTVNPQPLPEPYLYSVQTPVFHKNIYQDIAINKPQVHSRQLTIANGEFETKGKHPIQVSQTANTHTKLRLIPTVNPKPLPDPHVYSVRSPQFHKTVIDQDIDANEPLNDSVQLAVGNKELETNGKYPANQVSQSFGTKNKLKYVPAVNPKTLPDPHLYHGRISQFHNIVNPDISVNEPQNDIGQFTDVKNELETKLKYQAAPVPQSSSTHNHNQLRFMPTINPKPLPDPHSYSVKTPQFHKTDIQDYSTFNISSYSSSSSSHSKNGVSTISSKLLPKLSPYSRTSGSYEGLCSDLNAVQSKQLMNKYDNGNIRPINVCSNNVDEENEELEDSVIKFSHFGII